MLTPALLLFLVAQPARPSIVVLETPAAADVKDGAGVARVVTDAIVAGLVDNGAFVVTAEADARAALSVEAQRQLLGCTSSSCLSDLADAFGADWVASARVSPLGKTLVVGLSFFDRKTAAASQKGQVVVNKPEELPASVQATVTQMAARLASKLPRSKPVVVDRGLPGLRFIEVPGGTVFVGCASGDADCNSFEARQRVELASFAVLATEVTVAQYAACVRAGACVATSTAPSTNCNAGVAGRDQHPMNCVALEQAKSFCGWVGGRLPTADEWELAARGGKDIIYPWGNEAPSVKRLNYCDKNCATALSQEQLGIWNENNWIDRGADDGFGATAPVGSFVAGDNALGVKDAAGNVWELTTTETKRGAVQMRGGSWAYTPGWMRASMYNQFPVSAVDDGVGFRCVR